jgi:predicted acetyltransferase
LKTIELIVPTREYEKQILNYKKEFEINGDDMDGTAGLKNAHSIDGWFCALLDNSKKETVREGLVPASTYLALRTMDQKLIGMIDIRHELNDFLFNFGGHIGYSVRKCERRKGYAKEMLRLALEECKKRNLIKVLITCDKENIASSKTIIGNGGKLENEVQADGRITQRYWVNLPD